MSTLELAKQYLHNSAHGVNEGIAIRAFARWLDSQQSPRKAPPDHEWDEHGKCKWCPAQRTGAEP